jgi:hypothetical protein
MVSERRSVFVGARRAADLVRDIFNVVREVNAWRHEHDDFVAAHLDEGHRKRRHGRRRDRERAPNA